MNQNRVFKILKEFFVVTVFDENYKLHSMNLRVRSMYDISLIKIQDIEFILVKYKLEGFNLNELINFYNLAKVKEDYPVIFFFDSLVTQNKRALIKNKLSYIIGNKQFYIKELAFKNNDYLDRTVIQTDFFSASTQSILIDILSLDQTNVSQKELGNILKRDKVYISRALKELENKGLINRKLVNNRYYINIEDKLAVWNKSIKYLKDPVANVYFISKSTFQFYEDLFVSSGILALTERSNLFSNELVYAIEQDVFKNNFIHDYMPYPLRDGIKIEVWKSEIPLYKNKINPLALYLSLKNDSDERVVSELLELIKEFLRREY
jgi:DNA-binding MarR family transcriptional regulator